jgi:hypothetical protein
MRFAGIDVGSERHMVAMVGEQGEVLCRPVRSADVGCTPLSCWAHLLTVCGAGGDRAHRRNLFVALIAKDYVAGSEPVAHRSLCREELRRTKTDAIDARDRALPSKTTASRAAARFSDGRVGVKAARKERARTSPTV